MPANPNARKPKQTAKPANRRKAHEPPALVPATHDLSADVTLLNSVTTHRQNGRFAPGNPFAFRPGQSGNSAGRPKGVRYLSKTYRDRLAQVSTSDPEGRTHAQILGDMVVSAALSGNLKAITEVTDRTGPKPFSSALTLPIRFSPKNGSDCALQWPTPWNLSPRLARPYCACWPSTLRIQMTIEFACDLSSAFCLDSISPAIFDGLRRITHWQYDFYLQRMSS